MTQATDRPADASGPATLVLPRPNLGPEPWSEPRPGWGPAELAIGLALVAGLLGLATRRARRRRADRRPASDLGGAGLDPPDPTPSRRLIASAGPVRAALVAEFGVAWAARTTEEIALDPTLADRLGPEVAGGPWWPTSSGSTGRNSPEKRRRC